MDPLMGNDMLIDEYDMIDEKPEVAIITPADSSEEPEPEPMADDYEAMKARVLHEVPDLEIEAEGYSTWQIENYRGLSKKEHGPMFECGGHPWRILLFPYGNNVDHASFYLEQGFEDKPPDGWYACVQFVLVLWNKNDPSIYTHHSASHRFNADEGDWGFTRFAEIRKLFAVQWENRGRPMIENDAVNVTAYLRVYKDPTGVLWHNFNNYDSKIETGMVGLKNQGATCYLNSLLQSLYFTNAFRKAVYQIPTENEADRTNSAWALQRLFYQLQSSEAAVSTQELTQSFGWETKHIFEQQDVQELSRILMERMEERMKGTAAENALAKMFVGKMKTYISCINVDYESSRIEDFWDIQLNVSGNKNLDDSFKDYIQVETMDGENKYFAEGFGLQDARKGVIFESFPQVLHLQLKRFEYDINRDAMMKVNDRYEFPEVFDAAPYLSDDADRSESYMYQLHGVLVHSGDFNAGHYYAYLRPTKDGHFYKFDDDRVTRATLKEALEENFGGDYTNPVNGNAGFRNPYTRTLSTKRSMSAYMLVYIRQTRADNILLPVTEQDTPPHIAGQLNDERALNEKKRKEREEQHLYLSCAVITDEHFKAYQGLDLAIWDSDPNSTSSPDFYRILRASTIREFCQKIAEDKHIPAEQVRLWVMVNRQNKTVRPDQPLIDPDMTVEEAFTKYGSRDKWFRLWAEVAEHVEDGRAIWPDLQPQVSNNVPILVFLKYFDPEAQTLRGVGHIYVKKHAKVADMVPMICQLMGWSPGPVPNIALYEEIKHSMIEPMKGKMTLHQAEIQDGDIVCFQKVFTDAEVSIIQQSGNYANTREFYDYLLNRIVVRFSPRPSQNSEGEIFDVPLSKKMSYDQFSAKVGEYLKVDPTHIRFSTTNATTMKPKSIVRRNPNQNLYQILHPQFSSYSSHQRSDMLFYEVMDMSLTELETKKTMRLTWVSEGLSKEETHELLVAKNGIVSDLLTELKRKVNLDEETIKEARIYFVQNSKIQKELPLDYPVTSILEYYTLIAERIPEDERNAQEGDRAIYAFHFDKEANKVHGIPFKFYIKPGETLKEMKPRLSKRTGIKGKQFENIKFALVSKSIYSKPSYLNDDDVVFDLAQSDDLFALDHVNKSRTQSNKGDSIFIR
ncbi:hypothetical protein MMC18_008233 [Xylographa bjoerkii]|nr:hypothetical protein [Xylographa bjoerkii]